MCGCLAPSLGTWTATKACALAGNRTSNPLVHRPALNPLSQTSQGLLGEHLKVMECKVRLSVSDLGRYKKHDTCPGWCGSVGWSTVLKACPSGHMPGLGLISVWEPVRGNQLMFLCYIELSFSFSPSLPLSLSFLLSLPLALLLSLPLSKSNEKNVLK